MCGACAARVRSILSADDRVDSAAVNMLTETAAVRLGTIDDEPERVAEELAERLAQCGFPSKRRRTGLGVQENVRKWREMAERKEKLLAASRNRVAFAWTLVALCCGSHGTHLLHSLGIHVAHGEEFSPNTKTGDLFASGVDILKDADKIQQLKLFNIEFFYFS